MRLNLVKPSGIALVVSLLLIAQPTTAQTTYAIQMNQAAFGWLSQHSLDDSTHAFIGAHACVPTSMTNALVYLQNAHAFYYGDRLAGSTYADWLETDAVLVSESYMATEPGFGTPADRTIHGINQRVIADGGFDLFAMNGMIPEDIWLLRTPEHARPDSINDAAPTWQFLEASLARGNPTLISLIYYPEMTEGHATLVTGLEWTDANDDGVIQPAENARLLVVDPLDSSESYNDGYPSGAARLTDVHVWNDAETGVLVMNYNQYNGSLPYDPADYSNSGDNGILAALAIDTQGVRDYMAGVARTPRLFGQLPEAASYHHFAVTQQLNRQTVLMLENPAVDTLQMWASVGGGAVETESADGALKSFALGAGWRANSNTVLGVAFNYQVARPDWGQSGHYDIQDYQLSLHGGYRYSGWTLTGFAAIGSLDYRTTRRFQIGPDWRTHRGKTDGEHMAVGVEAAYQMQQGAFIHGPFIGINAERIEIDRLSEKAEPEQISTTLNIDWQTRDVMVGSAGWRTSWHRGRWAPHGAIALNRDFRAANDDLRLTSWAGSDLALSTDAPRETWGSLNVGVRGALVPNTTVSFDIDLTRENSRNNDARATIAINVAL